MGNKMTKEQFVYILTACGCLYKDGQVWYEENELIKRFEDMGAFDKPMRKDYAEFFDWENEFLNG